MKQVVFTRVNFLTENSMERENIPYLMDINMKVIGKKENRGFGKAKYPDGSFYEGAFVDGQHSGEGKIFFPDGSFYEGNWLEGNFNGYGTLVYSNGITLEGNFSKGLLDGKGTQKNKNGYIYIRLEDW